MPLPRRRSATRGTSSSMNAEHSSVYPANFPSVTRTSTVQSTRGSAAAAASSSAAAGVAASANGSSRAIAGEDANGSNPPRAPRAEIVVPRVVVAPPAFFV